MSLVAISSVSIIECFSSSRSSSQRRDFRNCIIVKANVSVKEQRKMRERLILANRAHVIKARIDKGSKVCSSEVAALRDDLCAR